MVDHTLTLLPKKITSVLCQEELSVSQDADGNRAYVWLYKHANNIKREKQHLTFVQLKCFISMAGMFAVSWTKRIEYIAEKYILRRYISKALKQIRCISNKLSDTIVVKADAQSKTIAEKMS
jgi:PIN domain nuclease of toxin-antitoxin system